MDNKETKNSNKTLFIVLGIIAGLILLCICGCFGVAVVNYGLLATTSSIRSTEVEDFETRICTGTEKYDSDFQIGEEDEDGVCRNSRGDVLERTK